MSKTISDTLKAHMMGEVTTIATCWHVTRADGEEFFFTDHDTDLVIDGDTYEAASGMIPMSLTQSPTLTVDNMDVVAFLESDKISEADILAGLYDYAVVDVFLVDYTNVNANGGESVSETFGTLTYSNWNQRYEITENIELGHFSPSLIVSAWDADVPACTVTKLWVRLRWVHANSVPIRIAVYDATSSSASEWTVEVSTQELTVPGDSGSMWHEFECDLALTAGKKALAIIAYDIPEHPYGLTVFYDFTSGTPSQSIVTKDAATQFNDPLGDLGASDQFNWCLYAEYSYTLPLTDKLWLARNWTLGQIEIRDNEFQVEIRGIAQHLQQEICETITPQCRASLGDARCGVDLDDSAGTYKHTGSVTSVTEDRKKFVDTSVDSSITTDVFRFGVLTWLEPSSGDSYTGSNADLQMEIKSYDPDTNEFELFQSMPYDIEVSDEFEVTYGCDKSIATCRDTFNNVDNFRGEPFVPGWDRVVHIQRP